MLRVGMLTSGGDCQALNATMRGVYKAVTNNAKEPVEFYGFEDGYKGLMYGKFRLLNDDDFSNILTVGVRFLEHLEFHSNRFTNQMPMVLIKLPQ